MSSTKTILSNSFSLIKFHSPAWIWFDVLPIVAIAVVATKNLSIVLDFNIVLTILVFILIDTSICIINDITDAETDRRSADPFRYNRPIASGAVSKDVASYVAFVLALIAILLSHVISSHYIIAVTFLVIWGVLYSLPPIRMSGRPIVSQLFWVVLWIAYIFAVITAVGGGNIASIMLYFAGVVFFYALAETLAKDIRDYENDKETGKNTTPTRIGIRASLVLSIFFSVIGCVFFFLLVLPHNYIIAGVLLFVLALWNLKAVKLAREILFSENKEQRFTSAKRLHRGYIYTFALINALAILSFVTFCDYSTLGGFSWFS